MKQWRKKREEIIKLDISEQNLEGELDLSSFINLIELSCWDNELTSLNVNNCRNLKTIVCYNNLITNLTLSNNLTNLKELGLSNNNFPKQDLSFLKEATNLEQLTLGNDNREKVQQSIYNKFTDSLDHLSGMEKLKILDISDTDLNEVDINKLPKSLEQINYLIEVRPDCKLTTIASQLEKYGKYGRCLKCWQTNTSYKWCQPCAEKEWEKLFGQELIEKFIQQQQLRGNNEWNKLNWIPYKDFNSTFPLAKGGFSEIYKTNWGKDENGNDRIVVLKSLNNSQKVISKFLTEIANTKLVCGSGIIVNCHGISQDPETKNYIMVMDYKEEGDLRKYLQQKGKELNFKNKLDKLKTIANGLRYIHFHNLVHCDFHMGNILNSNNRSYITDLGLCQSANSQLGEGKIYGVLPYVSPEVLQGGLYTKVSDVYSFGIIAYELLANAYPYPKMNDIDLALKVCQGFRPNIDKLLIPKLLKDLVRSCWDTDTAKRSSAEELYKVVNEWGKEFENEKDTKFYQQYQAIKEEYDTFSKNTPYQIHPTATTISKPINTKKIVRNSMNFPNQQNSTLLNLAKLIEKY